MDADTRSRPGAALASSPPGHTTSARARVPALDEPAQSNDTARGRAAPRVLSMAALLLVSVALVDLGGVLARSWKPRTCRVHMLTVPVPSQTPLSRRIAAELLRHGLAVELSSRPVGTLEALELVDSPNPIDLALVAGAAHSVRE
jgi:hypothetical protein